MTVDYPGAQDMMLPTDYSFSSVAPLVIIIHKTGGDGTLDAVHNTFLNTKRSTHFAIDENGQVAQFVPLNRGAGGNCCADSTHQAFWDSYINAYGNLNYCTISIEHCDNTSTNTEPMSQAQINASRSLVRWLCNKFGIPSTHIKPHNSINATDCPGNYPLADLINFIQGGSMPVPTGWSDNGTTLTASNKVPVVAGFRQHILNAASWDSGNVPQESEYHTDQVLLHNAAVGAGQRQVFRDTLLWYTTAKGVVEEPYVGLELDAAYKQIDALKAQLAQQQTPAPADNAALIAAINAIPDAIAGPVAAALVEAKKI